MRRVFTAGLTLLIGGLTAASQATATPCSGNDFLQGNYGAQLSGTVTTGLAGGIGGMGAITPKIAGFATTSGRLTLDGFGKVTGSVSSNTNGAFRRGVVTGTYSVRYVDCTVTIVLTDDAGGVQHFDGVIAARGDTVLLIQTDKGAGLSGSMQRSRNACDASNMERSYAFRRIGNSSFDGGRDGSDALTSIGTLIADGEGNFTMNESMFSNGAFTRTVTKGTYTVNYDCSVVLRVVTTTAPGSATMLQGQLVNSDTELLWIQADNGSSVTGALSAQ